MPEVKLITFLAVVLISLTIVSCDPFDDLPPVPSISKTHKKSGKQNCLYNKGPWSRCTNGMKSREDILRAADSAADCDNTRITQKKCKSVCRYNKGPWSECVNGEKSRTDTLKTPTPGCEQTKLTNKKCKPACRYAKGDWTPCENGEKKRTLTRLEGDGPECEATKVISKQCSPQAKKPKQPRNKQRKSNSSTVTQSQTY